MRQIKQLFFSFLLITLASNYSLASHVSGGNISYVYTGIPNTYQVTLSLYRDCSGISAPSQGGNGDPVVSFSNNCGHAPQIVTFPNIILQEISALDPTYCPDLTTCGGGSLPGMQLLQYQATVVLQPCNSWTMSYSLAARNTANNVGGGNFYVETVMNSSTSSTNTSPALQWTPTNGFDPIPYGCVGSLKTYAPNVVEPDGDSLVFSFTSALTAPATPIGYAGGATFANPIGATVTIDPVTGLMTWTATMPGIYVVTILIEEYDGNGNYLGSVLHDFQFVAEVCVNNAPVAPNQVVNYNNINTNATLDTVNNTISLCAGDQFCFDLTFTDPDGDSITLFSNVEDILPNSTFTFVYVSPDTVIGTVCWAYQPGYTGSIINVTANELICIPGSATFSISLDIPPPLNTSNDMNICGIQTADLSATGQGPLTWSVIAGEPIMIGTNFSCNPCNTPVATPSITTTYVVSDNSACLLTDTITVSVSDNFGGINVGINTPDTSICLWDCVDVDAYTEEAFYGQNVYPWTVNPSGLNGQVLGGQTVDVGLPAAAIGGLTSVVNGTICEVCFKINHPQAGDLKIELVAPTTGLTFLLADGQGGTQNAYNSSTNMVCFNMTSIIPILGSGPPFVNSNGYNPQGGNMNNAVLGSPVSGVWKLRVTNNGVLPAQVIRWNIKFCDPYVNWYQSSFFGWDNQDGMPATPAISPTVCPQIGGQYILSAYTVDYCFVNDTININLHPQPDAGNDTTVQVCLETGIIDLFTYLGGTPDNVGTWEDPNGNPVSPIINSNAVMDSLPYLYVAESPNGCIDSAYLIVDIIEVTIDDTLVVDATCIDFFDGEITVFATNALSYQIDGLNSGYSQLQNTNIFTGLGYDNYTVTAYNQPNGQFCSATMFNVEVTQPELLKITNFNVNHIATPDPDVATAINPTFVEACEGKSVPLKGVPEGGNENGFYQFEWYMNNSYIGTGQNWTTPNNQSGPGYVILNDGFCPADTAFFDLNHYTPIFPKFTTTDNGCAPLEVTFSDQSSFTPNNYYNTSTISFSNGSAVIVNSQSSNTYTFLEHGVYDVTMSINSVNSNSSDPLHVCKYDTTYYSEITAFDAPRLKFNPNPEQITVYQPTATMINLSPSGGSDDAVNFEWSFGSKADPVNSTATNPTVTYTEGVPGRYPVKLEGWNINGCYSSINGEVQIINDVNVFAPNIFTPDGNQFNQTWRVYISGIDIYDYELVIYNRFGEVVFQSFDSEATWNGTYGGNGEIVQDGTYPWVITAKDAIDDNKYEFKGTINVVK